MREVAVCLNLYGLYVIPHGVRAVERSYRSIWALCDPANYGGIVWRQNTGFARIKNYGVQFGIPGQADWTGWIFKDGRRLELEVKSAESNGQLRPDQKARHELCLATGVWSGVVRSFDECAKFCEWMGLKAKA